MAFQLNDRAPEWNSVPSAASGKKTVPRYAVTKKCARCHFAAEWNAIFIPLLRFQWE